MAAVPVVMQVMIYPKNKTDAPYPATIAGFAQIAGLHPDGEPIIPPGEELPKPPGDWEIWPPDRWLDTPEHPIVLPPEPPIDPPPDGASTNPVKPNAWNWNDGKNPQYPTAGWYYVHVPGPTDPAPKGP